MRAVPMNKWVWCGYPGHFCAAERCRLHLHTRVGDYRISTVGDYHPASGGNAAEEIGAGRLYETFVFRVSGYGEHGEGVVDTFCEIDSEGYNDPTAAERGHIAMCKRYARVSAGLEAERDWAESL